MGVNKPDMKDDVEKYIERRKRREPAFAKGLDAGYADFKIGTLLRQAREDAGVTQEKLARLTKTKTAPCTGVNWP